MRKKVVVLLVCCVFFGMGLTACGSGAKVTQHTDVSLGQQLMDLDKAYKQGALTEKEFNKQKKRLLDNY